jgi:hypothetical protein
MKHTPPPQHQTPNKSNKIPTFYDIKHWDSASVTDAASLGGGSVSNHPRVSGRI